MRDRATGREAAKRLEVRCAIYTRKSSEEGLEQEFNSLHAQREACLAYILSQRHEGWRALPSMYDDGGISGGTMDRPALSRLLDDIRAKRVDLIVIYKVDRLTRSLADFAKLVDIFNAHDISFVSVTQQFNTATSMGRLTLNMLLSFAQFEREVTGERIRDKIAASKRKGMWMGGYPPLGYDVRDRKLVVNHVEALQVQQIFRSYLELGSVRQLAEHLQIGGIRTKRRQTSTGPILGGRPFMRGNLYEMLQNRLYRGQVGHKGNVYDGEHTAIIDQALWDQVQAKISENRVERSNIASVKGQSLLTGLAYDKNGDRLTPTHAKKGSKRYRYYVSERLIAGTRKASPGGQRIPAGELEQVVIGAIQKLLDTPSEIHRALFSTVNDIVLQKQLLDAAALTSVSWKSLPRERVHSIARAILNRVDLYSEHIDVGIHPEKLINILLGHQIGAPEGPSVPGSPKHHVITASASLQRAGQEMRLVVADAANRDCASPILLKLIKQALQFRDRFLSAQDEGIAELAGNADVSGSHFTRVLRLGFLAPDILVAIVNGQQPVSLTATKLLKDTRLPLCWAEQRKMFSFPEVGKTG